VPSLDLRFADNKSLVDAVTGASLVTFTRASSGTFVDSAGVLQTATTDAPRFGHNPTTGESLGLLVEEQRTNSISNNTMVGAVAGTPGTLPTGWPFQSAGVLGLSVSIVGTGTESGIAYLDWKVSGTATAATGATISFGRASALTAQTWTISSYLKLAAGSLSGVTGMTLDLIEETATTVFVAGGAYSISLPTTNSLITQRPTTSRTLTGGATVALLRTNLSVNVSSGSTVDFTIRIGLPQLEQSAFATSPIPTTSAAVTRSADVCSISGSNFSAWYRQDEGTVFHQGRTPTAANFFSIDDATTNNRITSYMTSATAPFLFVSTGGVAQANITSSAITAGSTFAQANGYKAADFAIVTNGGTITAVGSGTVPVVNRMIIGANTSGSAVVNGTIRRLTYWPVRLGNNVLQQVTQ
jgi:hypothetical protein